MYKVKITIDPIGYEQETVTSNIQGIADMFGLDTSIERFFSTINFAVTNVNDLRNVLNEIGFGVPIGTGVDFTRPNTEG
jgi:predicted Ser/Thr protein kinase